MNQIHGARRAEVSAPRVWPAIVLLIFLIVLPWVPALFTEQTLATRMMLFLGPQVCVLLILVWWLFLSRIPIRERLFGMGGIALILTGTMALSDASMSQGFGIIGSVIPWGMTAFVVGFIASNWLPGRRRTAIALLAAFFRIRCLDPGAVGGRLGRFQQRVSLALGEAS